MSNDIDKNQDDNYASYYEYYLRERDILLERELSNSQIFDKAILILSSLSLVFCLLFLQKEVALSEGIQKHLLNFACLLFIIALTSTLVSFLTSQQAIKKQYKINEQFYFQDSEESNMPKNLLDKITAILGYISLICLIIGIIFAVILSL